MANALQDQNQNFSVLFAQGTLGTADVKGTAGVVSGAANPLTGAQYVEQIGAASGYTEGSANGTLTGNVILFRDTGGTLRAIGTANPLPVTLTPAIGTANPLQVTLTTAIAGEDLTNNVLKTEQRFSYYHHVGTAGAVLGTVKSGAGFLHSLIIGNHTAGGTYTLFDSIGTSATVIGIIASAGAVAPQYIYDVIFSTGLTISSGSVADVTVSYR